MPISWSAVARSVSRTMTYSQVSKLHQNLARYEGSFRVSLLAPLYSGVGAFFAENYKCYTTIGEINDASKYFHILQNTQCFGLGSNILFSAYYYHACVWFADCTTGSKAVDGSIFGVSSRSAYVGATSRCGVTSINGGLIATLYANFCVLLYPHLVCAKKLGSLMPRDEQFSHILNYSSFMFARHRSALLYCARYYYRRPWGDVRAVVILRSKFLFLQRYITTQHRYSFYYDSTHVSSRVLWVHNVFNEVTSTVAGRCVGSLLRSSPNSYVGY